MRFYSSVFSKTFSNIREVLFDKRNRTWAFGLAASVAIGSTITISAYLDYRHEARNIDITTISKEIPFPSKDLHYELLSSREYAEGQIEIYISLTSKESRSAYTETSAFAKKNNLNFSVYHLSQNPEWEMSAKTFHALQALNSDIDLTKYFDLLINLKKESDLNKLITPLLIEDNINPTTFSNTLVSIETIQSVNDDLERSNKLNIDFIPSIILHNNRLVYFGLFDSYSDSLRLYEATKKSNIDTKTITNNTSANENN